MWASPRSVEAKTVRAAGVAGWQASDIPAHQFVELRVTVPRQPGQNVDGAETQSGTGCRAISAAEQKATDDFN